MIPLGRPLAYLLMREMLSMDPKVQRSRWELKLGLDLLRSITAKGVIIPLSSQLGFRGFRIYSSKIALGWRFAVYGVSFEVLKYQFLGGSIQFSLPMGFKVFLL